MKLLKPSYWSARCRSFFERLTLNRFTIFYFSLALLSCVVLVVLQAVTLVNNSAGVTALSGLLSQTNASQARDGLPLLVHGNLALCDGLPGRSTVTCQVLWGWNMAGISATNNTFSLDPREADAVGETLAPSTMINNPTDNTLNLPNDCIYSLRWLIDTVKDSRREDVVTLCFQIWLFSLAFVTLLNESIPHLAAGVLGHILGTGWAAYRVESTVRLTNIYRKGIVPQLCSGQDFLKGWWDQRRSDAVGIIVVNACTLVAMMFLSYKILMIYARQSFACVGASDKIQRIYKIILLFSAALQLTGFFSLASTGIWLDKINQGIVRKFAVHHNLYLAAFIVTVVLLIPWLVLGWICVRRECARRYAVFCAISLFLVTLFTILFFSQVYRFIFLSWSFFATITVTSYICVVVAAILGIFCRLNFGKGLAHYLQVNDALAGDNFTADTFYDQKSDSENVFPLRRKGSAKASEGTEHHLVFPTVRGSSVYSRPGSGPIILSSTPPDVKSLISAPDSPYGVAAGPTIIITREIETKEDPLPPTPAKSRLSATFAKPRLRVSELPERLSSLTSLRQAINAFPLPPTAAPSPKEVSRYAQGLAQNTLSQDGKSVKSRGNIEKSGWL